MIPGGPGAVKVTAGCSRGSRLALCAHIGHSAQCQAKFDLASSLLNELPHPS